MISEEFVVDDLAAREIPQHRHIDAPGVVGLRGGVDLIEKARVTHRIRDDAGAVLEGPAVLGHVPMHHRQADHALQALHLAKQQGAMRPRTGERHIQVIAAGLSLEAADPRGAGRAVRGHPVAEQRRRPRESAGRVRGKMVFPAPHAVDKHSHPSPFRSDARAYKGRRGRRCKSRGAHAASSSARITPAAAATHSAVAATPWMVNPRPRFSAASR